MLAIALGITMAVLDSAVANVALPTIARELQTSASASVWVVNAYQLAIMVSLLPLAVLGERIGYRRVYQAGLIVFTAGSLACALSHTLAALVVARVLQGFGATGIMSVNGALVRYTYPQRSLGRGVGLNALVVSMASAAGPTIASAILAVGPWEWLFAINVPIGLVNMAVAARALPHNPLSRQRFQWLNAGLNALMFGLVFIAADTMGDAVGGGGTGAVVAGVELCVAIAAGVTLLRRERNHAQPLIPVDLLRIPIFALSVATSICSFAAYMLAFVVMPFTFQTMMHRNQVETGLLMTPWPVAVGLVAPLAGRLSDRVPAAILGTAGLSVLAIGLMCLSLLPADASTADIAWRMALCGFGFGFFQSPNNRTLLSSAPRSRAGAAGGMLATARLTGQTTGATIAALVFRLTPGGAEHVDLRMGAGLAALAAVASALRLPARRSQTGAVKAAPGRVNAAGPETAAPDQPPPG